jgi:hypothetical protein
MQVEIISDPALRHRVQSEPSPIRSDAVSLEIRELYASPNGDRWYLARYVDSGRVFVQHVPNVPSGGQPTNIELADFLGRGGNAPEHQALVRLIGTLVGTTMPTGSGNENEPPA